MYILLRITFLHPRATYLLSKVAGGGIFARVQVVFVHCRKSTLQRDTLGFLLPTYDTRHIALNGQ